jgi:hypothetical protein
MFTCHKALLLLALGQPERAQELLTPLRASALNFRQIPRRPSIPAVRG